MDKLPSIPSVPSAVDKSIGAVIRPIRETLIHLTEDAVSFKRLKEMGLVTGETPDGRYKPPAILDTTVPPTPTGLRADGALANIILTWDLVYYTNHSYTEIWAAQVDSFAEAQLIANGAGITYTDNVGGAAVKYYWIRYVSTAGVKGAFNAQVGTRGETATDPEYLLEILTNKITKSQLYIDLGTEIDKIEITRTNLLAEETSRQMADGALSIRLDTLNAAVNGNSADIQTEQIARANAVGALSAQIDTLSASTSADINAKIYDEQVARANADGALSATIQTLSGTVGGNTAAIQNEQTARANADGALSTRIDTLSTTVGNNTAAIQTEQTVRANLAGDLYGKVGAKIDLNGYITGWGLLATVNNAAPTSAFAVRADKFYIASPSGPDISPTMPFVVVTTPYYEDAITLVQPGVYIKNAVIADGTIKRAKIGVAAIDTARIADLAVTNAKIDSLDATKIKTGYLDAARIKANSITGDHLQVGTVDASVLKSGVGSFNLFPNSAFMDTYLDGNGRKQPSDFGTDMGTLGSLPGEYTGINYLGDTAVVPALIKGFMHYQPNADSSIIRSFGTSDYLPVSPNAIYECSAYFATIRCSADFMVTYFNVSGAVVGEYHSPLSDNIWGVGNGPLAPFSRVFGLTQAPSNAVLARVGFRRYGTKSGLGYTDSHVAFIRPYFGPAVSSSQTQPTPWTPAGLGTQISGGLLKTNSVTADRMSVTSLSAISATIGTLRTATTGARTEISDNVIKVYDNSGTLRVKIGNLAL